MTSSRISIKKSTTNSTTKRKSESVKRQVKNRSVKLSTKRGGSINMYFLVNRLYKNAKKLHIPRNVYNLGTVTSLNNRYLSVRLSRKLINNLKDIYVNKSLRNQSEYVGVIPFTMKNTRNYVNFHSPTARTNFNYNIVRPTVEQLKQYIVYHTHPIPLDKNGNLFTYPSRLDFITYIEQYPNIQANLILENNGYYIIDLLETNMRKPNPSSVNQLFTKLVNESEFKSLEIVYRGLLYVKTTTYSWKRFINRYIDPIMRHQFGISVKYHTWSDLGKITLIDKNLF